MKKTQRLFVSVILGCMALFVFVGCSDSSTVSKDVTVKASGKAVSNSRSVDVQKAVTPDYVLASGGIAVNGSPIGDFKPVDGPANSNSVTFEATVSVDVPVKNPIVKLSADPEPGFVFDEWEVDKAAAKADQVWKDVRLTDVQKKSFTLEIDPNYVRYYTASFEPGYYVDSTNGDDLNDGSHDHPFKTIGTTLSKVSERIVASDGTDDDDDYCDEFVLVVSGDFQEDVVIGLSEEISIKGGYASDWSQGAVTKIKSVTIADTGDDYDEIEISNVEMSSFTAPGALDEMEGCTIGSLTITGGEPAVITNSILTGPISVPVDSVFVNCHLTQDASLVSTVDCSYYHCLMDVSFLPQGGNAEAKNNIVIDANAISEEPTGGNYVLNGRDAFSSKGYITENADLIAKLSTATGFSETDIEALESKGVDDDALEEDITGFERPEIDDGQTDVKWSYGPYEYIGRS